MRRTRSSSKHRLRGRGLPRAARTGGRALKATRSPRARGAQRYDEADQLFLFVLRRLQRAIPHGGRPGALPRLPGVHPGRPQRRPRERGAHGHAFLGPAGQGGGAGDRPPRGSLAGHRALRLRRAQRAAGDDGHGAGRHVRPAGRELEPLPVAQSRRERHGLPGTCALQRLRGRARRGGRNPALLSAAAAMEARAFPAFVYDAAGGDNWATRFSLDHNRKPDIDWALEPFEYADEAMQRVSGKWRSPTPTSRCATIATPSTSPSFPAIADGRDDSGKRVARGQRARGRRASPDTCSRSMRRTSCTASSSIRG